MTSARTKLDIDGVQVEVSNLSKVFYPKSGFTKGQVIDYYVRISPYLLPHLQKRPIYPYLSVVQFELNTTTTTF